MSDTHNPKYLKQDSPTTQEMEDAEVFAIVNGNPNRKVDLDKVAIILEADRMFLAYPAPAKSEVSAAVCVALVFLLAVAVLVVALAAPGIGTRLLTFCATTLLAAAIISNTKGEKKNVQQ